MTASNQGILEDRYKLIPRTLIFITHKEHLLLLKGDPQKRIWANLYNGIGGHIEQGEDPLNAAQRELHEETGLHVPDLKLVGVISIDTGENTGIGLYVFHSETANKEVVASKEGELKWVAIDQVYELPLVEDLFQLLPKILRSELNSPPFSALYTYHNDGKMEISFSR